MFAMFHDSAPPREAGRAQDAGTPAPLRPNEEVAALRCELAEVRAQLRQVDKLATVGHLSASAAHEIGNPLGCVFSNFIVMQGYVEALLEIVQQRGHNPYGPCGAEHDTRLAMLRREATLAGLRHDLPALMEETCGGLGRVRAILRNMQDFARSDGGAGWRWVDLHHGIDATLAVAATLVRQRADVVREFGALPPVYCSPEQMNQVVMNLVINATHAMGARRGTLTVRTGVQGERAWLSVSDTGAGIAAEHLPRIFEPFFTTKPAGVGTGLGLALARDIVQEHRGRIEVETSPGQGSTFRVLLPLRVAGVPAGPAY
ncbi:sensor histidine kinase [Massilia aquatica]|uniref:histidine kinase n=1 Tax=Massilia aquatica TaxID=2609000 RepID=A0ABX0MC96_9BURK|nr:ATP-binding protein [Massilia aquatica]NHZ44682.1 ATPase [Massilia aquatica]